MQLLIWLLFGLIVGVLAKTLLPTPGGGGCLQTSLLVICGSLVGGFLGSTLGLSDGDGGLSPSGLVLSVLGAATILVAGRFLTVRR